MIKQFLSFLSTAILFAGPAYCQSPEKKLKAIFLKETGKPQVMLLGVFHFAGEQVDKNTTDPALAVNILSSERQEQVAQLVKHLAAFKPTKIVIEAPPSYQHYYDSLYNRYRAGQPIEASSIDLSGEIYQLAFRLAKMLQLEKLYPVDAIAFRFNLSAADSILTFKKYKNQSDSSFDAWDKPYDAEKLNEDSMAYFLPLNRYLQYLNAPEKQANAIGRWLITTKRGSNTEPVGADGFITRYFNRNVRIYSNIQRTVTSPHDRILVIYGATHMYILKTLFVASPEFEWKDVNKYLQY